MDIHIDAEGLQKAILSQIASTTFGEALTKAVNGMFERRGWNNKTVIEEAATVEVQRYVAEVVHKKLIERSDELNTLIKDELSEEILADLVQKAVKRLVDRT